jgi:nucleoside 2-deoxyribosyltransferase
MTITAYLAGPDVFLPDACAHAARKRAICTRHGLIGRTPLDEDVAGLAALPPEAAWQAIYRANLAMMESCDAVIANLTPFRGVSADAGTLVEIGWFLGRCRPVFGYSNVAAPFAARSRRQIACLPDAATGMAVEDFGLPDNLMVSGAALAGGCPVILPPDGRDRPLDALDLFEACVAQAACTLMAPASRQGGARRFRRRG